MTYPNLDGSAGKYQLVAAASNGTVNLGPAGGQTRDFVDSVIVSGGATPGVFSLVDGATTVFTFTPTANTVVNLPVGAFAVTGWKANTGAAATTTTAMAIGRFT